MALSKADQAKDAYYRKKYGITLEEWKKILAVNQGKCWICYKVYANLNCDHEHKPGEKKRSGSDRRKSVRGALCFQCNKYLIGRRSDPKIFDSAAAYLRSTKVQDILKKR